MTPTNERTEQLIERVNETRRQVILAADTLRAANRHLVNLTRELRAEMTQQQQGESNDRTA